MIGALRRTRGEAARLAPLVAAGARGGGTMGRCPICGPTVFVAMSDWLRDAWLCARCGSIPRQRALVLVLGREIPDWRARRIHEFAPSGPGSARLAREAPGYTASQYWPDVPPGGERYGLRCEDLERLTFPDASLDLVVSQDVFEHVFDPGRAFEEISRVLRPGGAHVFTVPWYSWQPTRVRARRRPDGGVEHHEPEDYHGDPVDARGSLVATEWGPELLDAVVANGGLVPTAYDALDRRRGIDGWFREVFVARKGW